MSPAQYSLTVQSRGLKHHSFIDSFIHSFNTYGYIIGSENNSLYVYYHGLTKHVITHKFESVRNVLEKEKKDGDDQAEFVSAVCWRKVRKELSAEGKSKSDKWSEM